MTGQKNHALPQRILVADDEHLIATGLAAALERMGVEVIGPVADGSAAVRTSIEEHPDLAILDIRMPEMDGLEVASTLWRDYGVPSVIISAYGDPEYVSRAQHTGVFAYLLKPVNSEHLNATLAVAWARAQGHGEQHKRISQLERTLAQRRVVEQAKWKLIEQQGMTEEEAHSLLQKAARDARRPLAEIANEVLETGRLATL